MLTDTVAVVCSLQPVEKTWKRIKNPFHTVHYTHSSSKVCRPFVFMIFFFQCSQFDIKTTNYFTFNRIKSISGQKLIYLPCVCVLFSGEFEVEHITLFECKQKPYKIVYIIRKQRGISRFRISSSFFFL